MALPHTWRPRRARIFCYAVALLLMVVLCVVAAILPHDGAREWNLPSRLGVIGVGIPIAYFLHRHANVQIIAREDDLEIVNLFQRHRLQWGEILAVRLRRGDPWVFLDLSNGETIAAMGIQGSDGEAAPRAARALADLVHAKSA